MGKTREGGEKEEDANVWDCGSPLYDSYELVSLTHLIERHLMSLPSVGGSSRRFTGDGDDYPRPSDLAATVVDLCCSSSSTVAASRLGDVFRKKWWTRRKNNNNNGINNVNKNNMSEHVLCGLCNRSGSWKI